MLIRPNTIRTLAPYPKHRKFGPAFPNLRSRSPAPPRWSWTTFHCSVGSTSMAPHLTRPRSDRGDFRPAPDGRIQLWAAHAPRVACSRVQKYPFRGRVRDDGLGIANTSCNVTPVAEAAYGCRGASRSSWVRFVNRCGVNEGLGAKLVCPGRRARYATSSATCGG